MSESLQEIIGKGYAEFWKSKKRYVVCKGSRASKKSTTAALKIIVRMMEYPLANTLVVRKTASTLKDSCFAQLKWAISRLGVESFWKSRMSPLELEYVPTGQRIIFRGLDDAFKITSITVPHGHLCFAWLEEAYEVSEEDFDAIDESLRGKLPEGYYIQWLIIFNPWSSNSWLKSRFFDKPSPNVLAMTTTYKDNEWLSQADRERFEEMRLTNPQRYRVAGEANWGVIGGQYFSEWNERRHVVKPFAIPAEWNKFRAMDWGMAKPYAVLWFAVDYDGNLWCYRELYGWGGKANVGTGETAAQIGKKIAALEKPSENVRSGVLDSACFARTGVTGESIAEAINKELNAAHITTFSKSSKGRVEGANALKQRLIGNKNAAGENVPAIYFFANCLHTIRTLPMLGYDKHNPETYDTEGEDHCLVAGTQIKTSRGEIAIENVTTADYVLTRKGFRKVKASAKTRINAEVMTLEFSNGKSLTGTGNHPVYVVGKGFIRLDSISVGDIIFSESEVELECRADKQIQQTVSHSTELNSDAIQTPKKNQTENITEPAGVIASREFPICTGKFGNSTTATFPKGITCITKTEIISTTPFQILNYALALWLVSGKKRQSGTAPQKADNGTVNTELQLPPPNQKSRKLNVNASSAEKNFSCQVAGEISANSVPERVTQDIAAKVELTTKPEFVQSAGKNLASIGSAKIKPAAKNVAYVVCCRAESQRADVYNLTVEGEPEYFANGILVHNCVDACIYGCLSRPYAPSKIKPARVPDRYKPQEKSSVWAI